MGCWLQRQKWDILTDIQQHGTRWKGHRASFNGEFDVLLRRFYGVTSLERLPHDGLCDCYKVYMRRTGLFCQLLSDRFRVGAFEYMTSGRRRSVILLVNARARVAGYSSNGVIARMHIMRTKASVIQMSNMMFASMSKYL